MIRDATPDDIPRLVEMGERFLTETVYRGRVTVNPVAMARTVGLLLASEVGAVFVSEQHGTVVGMIGLLLFEHPITGELTASELFWWMDDRHRGGPDAIRLLRRGERWARELGAAKMHMIAPVGSGVGRLYQRCGYEELETAWQRDLQGTSVRLTASRPMDVSSRSSDGLGG